MFRKFLSTGIGLFALLAVAALPGHALAQHGRGMMRPGMVSPSLRFIPPIDRRFVDPRLNRLERDRFLRESELGLFGPALQSRALNARDRAVIDRRLRENLLLQADPILRRRILEMQLGGF